MKPLPLVLFATVVGVFAPAVVLSQVPVQPPAVRLRAARMGTTSVPAEPVKSDAEVLASVGLKADDPAGLVGYIRQRTLSDADLTRIQAVIRRLGDERFEERIKASAEVETFGPAAIAPLRAAAQSDPDPEIAYRAGETLGRMEKVSHTAVALAAVRALAKLKPTEAPPVLLGYLTVSDSIAVEDGIRAALVGMAVRDGQPDVALVAALKDPSAVRRGAAAVALIKGGAKTSSSRTPAALPQVKAAVTAEADSETKFRMVFALLTAARDADAVGELIGLIPAVPRGRLWQIEDYLVQLAGKTPPKVHLGTGKEALEKGRDQWRKWWESARGSTKLAAFEYAPKTTGRLLLVTMTVQGWANAKVAELGPDLKERWKIQGLNAPLDCRILPDGRILVMEQNHLRLTERDEAGRILMTRNLQGPPMGFQPLPDGETLVAYRHMVAEYDKDWKQTSAFTRNQSDILAAHRLANGQTLVLCQNPASILRLDEKGKVMPNPVKVGPPSYQPRMDVLSDDRVLVTEQNRVVEYDLRAADKREVWKVQAAAPSSVQRLPNGNTLIVEAGNNSVKEVAADGQVVWSYTPTDGMRLLRAERR
jgi:hypothetical protein